jgi:hypothetical protein
MSTLLQFRQYVAHELGGFLASTSGPSSTTVALIDPTWPITSSLSQDDYYTDYYLLRPAAVAAADRLRLVKTYAPATGTLTPDTAWTNAPAASEAYELHGVLNPATDMLDAINEGLKRCLIRTEIVGSTIAQVSRHSLATIAPWLSDPLWVRQVGWLSANDNRNQVNPYQRLVRGVAIEDDSTNVSGVAIEHPGYYWNGTELLYVRIVKRSYDHCRAAAGVFGGQSGLTLDTDEAPINLEWLGAAALVEIWRRNSQILETASRVRLVPNLADAAARFSYLTHQNFMPWPLTLTPYEGGGPLWSSGGRSW